ncbi:MAG: NB-ARC domain-containing protein [Calothrix sp. MO_192.B10]|nr:NB-ARC domain-containing protein [Calothrix sp. MO_192.B10]
MHSEEAVNIASQLIFQVTGKRLTDLQTELLKACWENQTYKQFAKTHKYTDDYVKDVGSDLWKLLSQALAKKVTKKNFHQALKEYQHNQQNILCKEKQFKRDLLTKPDVSLFFGRTEEVTTLKQWILEDRCRLIALLGIGGVGKTALAAKLVEEIQDEFDYVIWRSLRNAPPLSSILNELVLFFSNQQETTANMNTLLQRLQANRCLVILDNIETILLPGELAGEYCRGYEDYGELFRQIGEINHHSCFLLTSREKTVEVAELSGIELPVRYLKVCGSEEAAQVLINAKGLSGSLASKHKLCQKYNCNPLAVKIVASSIQERCGGEIENFLEQDSLIFNRSIRRLLTQQFERLSHLERVIMYWLAINRTWTSIAELNEDINPAVSHASLLEALESLCNRSLIEKQANNYTQQAVVMEYVTGCFIAEIVNEVTTNKVSLFTSHALTKTTVKDYIRESQIRLILYPIAQNIQDKLGSIKNISQCIQDILQILKIEQSTYNNYGAGNLINLASYLQIDLSYFDFSHLEIWQSDLTNVELCNVNFTQAHFHKSDFACTIFGIHCIAINSKGDLLATGETCSEIHLWQLTDTDCQQFMALQGHSDWIQSVVFTPNNKILASASFDTTIKLWDVFSGRCFQTLQGHHAAVMSVIFIPLDSQSLDRTEEQYLLASCSFDGTIKLWNISTGVCLKTLYGHTKEVYCISFNVKENLLASGSVDETIKIWNLSTGECIKTLLGHTNKVWSVVFTNDGKNLVSSSADKTIKLWDIFTGSCSQTLQGHSGEVLSLQLSPDHRTIASCSRDKTIRLWNVETGKNIRTFLGSKSWVWSVTFSPNSQHMITGGYDFNLNFWSVKTGKCLKRIQGNYQQTYAVAFSHDGKLLANSYWLNNNSIKIWDITSGKCIKILQEHSNWITSIAFSPDNQLLASGCFDQTIKIWDIYTGRCLKTMQGHHGELTSIIFSPNNKFIFSSSMDKTIKVWNICTGEIIRDFKGHNDWIHALALNDVSNVLASGGAGQNIKLWDVNTGECLKTLKGHTSWVFSIAFNCRGNILASASHDGTVRLFDIHAGHCINTLKSESERVYSVAFHPQNNILVSGQNDGTLKVWNVDTGECLKTLQSSNHEIWSLAFSPVCVKFLNKFAFVLACPGHDEVVNIWDLATGKIVKTLQPKKLYEGMIFEGATGLTDAQKKTLISLGAIN